MSKARTRAVTAMLVAGLVPGLTSPGLAQPAGGEPPPAPAAPEADCPEGKPWEQGVSEEEQDLAEQLYRQGNGLMRSSLFTKAAEKYREAVGHWSHPVIHYNLALALMPLDQPVEVHANLEKAMAYGTCALERDELDQAVRYKALVEQQLTRIVVSCTEPGARAFLDGKEVVACPGTHESLVRAGEHTVTASKEGFETAAVTRVFLGAKSEEVALSLYRPEDLTRYRRRFDNWLPYAVGGGGVALVAIGGLLHASAASSYDEFDQWASDCEAETGGGCTPGPDEQGLRDSGDTKQAIAFVGYALGGAAIVGGVTLLILNRPQPYRVDVEQQRGAAAVVPVIGKDSVGVQATLRF